MSCGRKFESICSQPTANDPLRFAHVLRLGHTIKPRICPGPSDFNLFFSFLSHLSSLFSISHSIPLVWFTHPHSGALTVKAKPIHLNRMKSHHRQSGFPGIFWRQVAIYTLLLTTQSRSALKHLRFGMVPKLVLPLQ